MEEEQLQLMTLGTILDSTKQSIHHGMVHVRDAEVERVNNDTDLEAVVLQADVE